MKVLFAHSEQVVAISGVAFQSVDHPFPVLVHQGGVKSDLAFAHCLFNSGQLMRVLLIGSESMIPGDNGFKQVPDFIQLVGIGADVFAGPDKLLIVDVIQGEY